MNFELSFLLVLRHPYSPRCAMLTTYGVLHPSRLVCLCCYSESVFSVSSPCPNFRISFLDICGMSLLHFYEGL
jgi:hypothetical protein